MTKEEVLAQEQEPVAYGTWDTMLGKGHRMMMVRLDKGQDGCTVPLYTTPPQRKPEQEPVAFICEFYADEGHPFVSFEPVTHGTNTPLYTTPPQRKPLTDEEIDRLWSQSLADTEGETYLPLREFARAIEAAHGIKENT